MQAIAIEAAEQCGRTVLPEIAEPLTLEQFLDQRDAGRTLYFADEGGGEPAAAAFKPGPALILIGPEGGFHRRRARGSSAPQPNAIPVSLGPRILRAETAALAGARRLHGGRRRLARLLSHKSEVLARLRPHRLIAAAQ